MKIKKPWKKAHTKVSPPTNATEADATFRTCLRVAVRGLAATMLTFESLDQWAAETLRRWPTALSAFCDVPMVPSLGIREGTAAVKFLRAAISADPDAHCALTDKVFGLIQSAEKSAISVAANLRGKN